MTDQKRKRNGVVIINFNKFTVDDERLQCAQNYWPRWIWRGLRVSQGRYGQDVCDEVPRQETH